MLARRNVVTVEPNPWWKQWKADWRDYELAGCCSKVVVFHMPGSSRTSWFVQNAKYNPRIVVVTDKEQQ